MVALLFALGADLAVLFLVMFCRSALENHEHHQFFIDGAMQHVAGEKTVLVMRIEKLDRLIKALYAVSGALFVAIAALGLWQLMQMVNLPQTPDSP